MDKDIERLLKIRNGGACCAEAIVKLGLEHAGEENGSLTRAVRGLCGGMRSGYVCGALTGAACMMSYFDKDQANADMIKELTAWFEDEFGALYGSSDCRDITNCELSEKRVRCNDIIMKTYIEAKEILLDHGFDITSAQDAERGD